MKVYDRYIVRPFDKQVSFENTTIPRHSFVAGYIAARGGGKTSTIMHMILRVFKGQFDNIYYMSPTFWNDPKLERIINTKGVLRVEKDDEDPIERALHGRKRPSGKVPRENIITKGFESKLEDILEELWDIFNERSEDNYRDTLIVLDDMASTGILKSKVLSELIFNSRHLRVSVIYVTQSYFQVAKPIRLNTTYFALFQTGNTKEIDNFYTEHHCYLDKHTWTKVYKQVTAVPFNFLGVNYQNDTKHRLCNGLRSFIQVVEEGDKDDSVIISKHL